MRKKIIWAQKQQPLTLYATLDGHLTMVKRATGIMGISEGDIDPVQTWCQETGIGRRTSFDTFVFRTEADMALFKMKWS